MATQPQPQPTPLPAPLQPRYLRTIDAARYLSISTWTLRDFVSAGAIKVCRVGSRFIFDTKELDRFMAERTEQAPFI